MATGLFEIAGTVYARNIAAWDGSSWSALGAGLSDRGAALAVYQGDLYAGGDFFSAGDLTVRHIARWDGQGWHDVGGGMSAGLWPTVTSLALHDDHLVAGGWFERAGGVNASRIAVWDGNAWSALGSGLDDNVWAVGSYGSLIVAAGDFHLAGAAGAAHIAAWDGQTWQALGEGVEDPARSVRAFGGGLYVGGEFLSAGGRPSFHIARWIAAGTAVDDRPVAGFADGVRLDLRSGWCSRAAQPVELTFALASPAQVTLRVHDLLGRGVTTLYAGSAAAGAHEVTWDGRDERGRPCARGVYFARLQAGSGQVVRRIVLAGAAR